MSRRLLRLLATEALTMVSLLLFLATLQLVVWFGGDRVTVGANSPVFAWLSVGVGVLSFAMLCAVLITFSLYFSAAATPETSE